jgi:hypothetical protein
MGGLFTSRATATLSGRAGITAKIAKQMGPRGWTSGKGWPAVKRGVSSANSRQGPIVHGEVQGRCVLVGPESELLGMGCGERNRPRDIDNGQPRLDGTVYLPKQRSLPLRVARYSLP